MQIALKSSEKARKSTQTIKFECLKVGAATQI